MADNMIELVAGLNVDDSAEQINKVDIPKLEKKLNAINIKCGITADSLNIKGIQQSINAAVKNTDVKINVGTDIKSSGINAQVKELEKALNISYPKGQTEELRKELKGLISDYQKAFQAEGGYGKQSESQMAKILEFATSYRQEIVHVNEDLKYTLDRIREIKKEQQQIFITADQKNALDDYAKKDGSTAKKMLDSALGATRWTSDPNKIKGAKPYYWSQFADEVNNINPFRDAIINENDIIQGIKDLAEITSKSFTEIDNSLDVNGEKYAEWALHVMQSVGDVTKLSPFEQELTIDTTNDVVEVNELSEAFSNLDKTVKTTENDVSTFRYPDISIGKDTKETLANAKDVLNEAFSKNAGLAEDNANRIKRAVEDTTGELQRFYVQVEKGDKSVETLTYALNEQGDAYTYLGKTIREADNSTDFRRKDVSTQWQIQAENLIKFANNADKAGLASTSLKGDIKELFETLNQANPQVGGDTSSMNAFLDKFDIAKAKYQALKAEISKENVAQKLDDNLISLSNRIEKTSGAFADWSNKNKRVSQSNKEIAGSINETTGSLYTYTEKWAELTRRLAEFRAKAQAGTLTADDIIDFKHLNEEINAFKKNADAANLTINSFFRNMRTQLSYVIMQWVSLQGAVKILRKLTTEVINVDTAMTELRKVTEATDAEFDKFSKSAAETAKELGASISDVINATATFSRLGYSLPDAEELGRVATVFKNVGDGITETEAAEDLVSTMKAFNIEAKDSISIVDKFNKVGNNFAISSGGIGEALKRSASALAAGNNDLSESIALITTANTIAQDPTTVGQGIKTVSLRLRSTKSELEEMGEDAEGAAENISKLRKQMLGLTGVDIQLNADTYKSTYQILLEISKVWGDLTDMTRASVLEQLFGKRQANIGAAILENGELLKQVYESAEDSVGSAMAEQEEYAKSIQKSIDSLKASFQGLAQSMIKSEDFKLILDTAAKLLDVITKIVDKIGTLPSVLGVVSGFLSFRGGKGIFTVAKDVTQGIGSATTKISLFGKELNNTEKIAEKATDTVDQTSEAIKNVGKVSLGAKVGVMALNVAITSLAAFAIKQIANVIKSSKRAAEIAKQTREANENILKSSAEATKSLGNEADEIGTLIAKYGKLATSTKDTYTVKSQLASLQDEIISKYGNEADGIDLVNKSIQENISLLNEKAAAEGRAYLSENAEGIARANFFFGNFGNATGSNMKMKDLFALASMREVPALVGGNNIAASIVDDEVVYTDVGEAFMSGLEDYLSEAFPQVLSNVIFSGKSVAIAANATPEEQMTAINALVKGYQKLFDSGNPVFKLLDKNQTMQAMYVLQSTYENAYSTFKGQMDALTKQEEFSKFKTGIEKTYGELLEKVFRAQSVLEDTAANVTDRITAATDLSQAVQQLKVIEEEYPNATKTFKATNNVLGISLEDVTQEFEKAKEIWLSSLDEAQKGIVADADKIIAAMTKIVSGEAIDAKSAWEILGLDDAGILSNIQLDSNGEYIFDLQQMIALKDKLIQAAITEREVSIAAAKAKKAEAEASLKILESQLAANQKLIDIESRKSNYNTDKLKELNKINSEYKAKIDSTKESIESYNYAMTNESLLLDEIKSKTGDLTNTQAMQEAILKRLNAELDSLNKQADGLLKAQTSTIDNIITKQEAELDVLEKQKEALEEQKENLEEILDHYKTVQDVVTSTIDKQIEAIEEEREAIEEYYDEQIKQLKAQNDERETAIEREQKLANLANAKNNKVRVYSEERGFEYVVDQDALKKAQNELDSFENSEKIKALEAEKEKATEGFDERIKEYEDYSKLWTKLTNEVTEAEEEQLAQEILGSDWRDKIKNKDTETVQQFQKAYQNYESSLSRLTKIEMTDLDKSIKAKQKEINSWKDYKTSIQDAATALKNANEDYSKYLNTVQIDENSTQATRIENLNTFVANYKKVVSQIVATQKDIDATTVKINNLSSAAAGMTGSTSVASGISSGASGLSDLASGISATASKIGKLLDLFEKKGGAFDYLKAIAQFAITGKLSDETAKNTGLSWRSVLHGARDMSIPDVAYTTPTAMSSPQGYLANAVNKNLAATTNFNISNIEINGVQNPVEFAQAFETQINRYWQTKLTENKVYQ